MTTGHAVEEEVLRLRKQPKKTSSQAAITRKPFEGKVRKELPIPAFIDGYNHYMGQVDVANQLRAGYTVHFNRNSKEFFPGIFWLIDMVNTNCWKIFQSLNWSYLVFTSGIQNPRSHRHFLEILVDLIFQCTDTDYPERVPKPPKHLPFEYPRYSYVPREQLKRKQILEILQPIRGIRGRPTQQIPASFAPLSSHKHILTEKSAHCVICRNSSTVVESNWAKKEATIPGTSVLSFTAEKPREQEQKDTKKRKIFRGTETKWKCNMCLQPICKGLKEGVTCWDLAHRKIDR